MGSLGLANQIQPAWTQESLRAVAFTPEQLYPLIGGPDYLRYLIPTKLVPFSSAADPPILDWMRHDTVASCAPMGLVDSECNPCQALSELIEPIRDCAFAVGDGVQLSIDDEDDDEDDDRDYVAYFGQNRATLCRLSPEPNRTGYNLIGLGGPAEWEQNFYAATGILEGFQRPSTPFKATAHNETEKECIKKIVRGSSHSAKRFAEAAEIDAQPLIELAKGIRHHKTRPLLLQGMDYRRTHLVDSPQLRDLRAGPQPCRVMELFPEFGVSMILTFTPDPNPDLLVWDDPQTNERMGLESINGSLLEYLTGVPQREWGLAVDRQGE